MQEYRNIPMHLPSINSLEWALFLDLDGTLIDIAAAPDAVVVPDGLVALLDRLYAQLGGALCILSGRSLHVIDELLQPLSLSVAGEHGAILRFPDGTVLSAGAKARVPEEWRSKIREITSNWPGLLIEEKAHGFVLHYRANPQLAERVADLLDEIVTEDTSFEVMPALMAREVRHKSINKGAALKRLMEVAPFRGRRPLFVGDDATDMDAIDAARELDGIGLLVGDYFEGSPANVRNWLSSLLEGTERRKHADIGERGK